MKLLSHLSYLSICLEYSNCITITFFLRKHLVSLKIVVFEMSHNIQISNSVAIIKYIHNLNMSSIINNVYLRKKINQTSIFCIKIYISIIDNGSTWKNKYELEIIFLLQIIFTFPVFAMDITFYI